jgi:hypothetical protein
MLGIQDTPGAAIRRSDVALLSRIKHSAAVVADVLAEAAAQRVAGLRPRVRAEPDMASQVHPELPPDLLVVFKAVQRGIGEHVEVPVLEQLLAQQLPVLVLAWVRVRHRRPQRTEHARRVRCEALCRADHLVKGDCFTHAPRTRLLPARQIGHQIVKGANHLKAPHRILPPRHPGQLIEERPVPVLGDRPVAVAPQIIGSLVRQRHPCRVQQRRTPRRQHRTRPILSGLRGSRKQRGEVRIGVEPDLIGHASDLHPRHRLDQPYRVQCPQQRLLHPDVAVREPRACGHQLGCVLTDRVGVGDHHDGADLDHGPHRSQVAHHSAVTGHPGTVTHAGRAIGAGTDPGAGGWNPSLPTTVRDRKKAAENDQRILAWTRFRQNFPSASHHGPKTPTARSHNVRTRRSEGVRTGAPVVAAYEPLRNRHDLCTPAPRGWKRR